MNENNIDNLNASSKLSIISRKLGIMGFLATIIGICLILFLVMSNFYSGSAVVDFLIQSVIVVLAIISLCGVPAVLLGVIGFIRCKQWNYFDRFNARVGIISGIITFSLLITSLFFLDISRKSSLLTSCANHRNFLYGELVRNIPGNEYGHIFNLPYDPDLPGYGVWAKYTHCDGATNCNHGAPHSRFGGWQYVNLPKDTLLKLEEVWDKKVKEMTEEEVEELGGYSMPVVWCGKPTGGYRLSLSFEWGLVDNGKSTVECWFEIKGATNERGIALLNECLKSIGEEEVPLNIPDNIDWSKYLIKQPGGGE